MCAGADLPAANVTANCSSVCAGLGRAISKVADGSELAGSHGGIGFTVQGVDGLAAFCAAVAFALALSFLVAAAPRPAERSPTAARRPSRRCPRRPRPP